MKIKTKKLENFVLNYFTTIVFAVVIAEIIMALAVTSPYNLAQLPRMLLYRTAAYVLLAIGVGGIMIIGGVDLSAGRVMGLCALVSAALLQSPEAMTRVFPNMDPMNVGVVLVIAVLIGAVLCAITGLIVHFLNAPTFIVTLASQIALQGGMLVFLDKGTNYSQSITHLTSRYMESVTGFKFGFPKYVIYAIVVVLLMWVLWRFTSYGKNMRAIGADKALAKKNGVNVFATTLITFAIAGAIYGFNGFIEAARIGVPGASTGINAELDAIAACLIGGVSIKGGKGGVWGIVIGVALLQSVSICLQFMTVYPNYVYIIKGGIIALAVILDLLRYKLVREDEE